MWTTERPTTAGWWWYRMKPEKQYEEIGRIKKMKDGLQVWWDDGQVDPVSAVQGEWQPVQLPQE